MYNGKRSKISKIALLIMILLFLPLLIISPVRAQQELNIVLIRAQYSASIGGHNEPIRDVHLDYKILDSTEWYSVMTNEGGQGYVALVEGSFYDLNVTMNDSQRQFLLEYNDEDILLISINVNNASIVGCSFISAFPAEDSDLPVSPSSNFSLQPSHIFSFLLGIVLTMIFIRMRVNK